MRRTFLAGLAGGLTLLAAGCGFQPVYDTRGAGIGPVEIAPIEGRMGHFLRQELLRRAALERRPGTPRTLTVDLSLSPGTASLRPDGFSNRSQWSVSALWSLTAADGRPATGARVNTMVGFDSNQQAYGDIALQSDAEERAAVQLADRIWMDVVRKGRAAP